MSSSSVPWLTPLTPLTPWPMGPGCCCCWQVVAGRDAGPRTMVPVNSAMSIVMVYTTIYNLTNGKLSRRGTVAPNEVLSQN